MNRKPQLSPIGIDIDGRSIAAAQLSRSENIWRLEAASLIPRMTPNAVIDSQEVERLTHILNRQGFTGTDVVLGAPSEKLLSGVFELPPAGSGAPVEQLARMELARLHKCEPDSFELAFWELPARQRGHVPSPAEQRGVSNVMAAAYPISESDLLLNVFEDQGWNVTALDIQSWATARAYRHIKLQAQESSAASLHMRWSHSILTLQLHDVIVYERVLEHSAIRPLHSQLAGSGINAELADYILFKVGLENDSADCSKNVRPATLAEARRLLMMYLDAIVQEVRTSCSYMAHRYVDSAPRTVLLSGEGAAIPGAAAYLAHELDMDARVVGAADLVPLNAPTITGNEVRGSTLVTAIGLAQHAKEAA